MKQGLEDLAGGMVLAAIGLFVALYAVANYDIGTLRRMGPGFFPVLLGGTLAILGLLIALRGWTLTGGGTHIAFKETFLVLAAIIVFALGLERAGLVVTTMTTALIASLATPDRRIGWRLVLAATVTLLSVAVFHFGLKMTLPLWPGWS